jgi:hypothetical protein
VESDIPGDLPANVPKPPTSDSDGD